MTRGGTKQLTAEERARAARIGVYHLWLSGYDEAERTQFSRSFVVCLNHDEVRETIDKTPMLPGWEHLKSYGPRSLLSVFESGGCTIEEAHYLMKRAEHEPFELLPEPLSDAEAARAERTQVYLIWYEDKFHFGDERDSFATTICLSRDEAEQLYRERGYAPPPSGGDGYDIVGPIGLRNQPVEVVREVLRRLDAGEPGPVPIPSKYW